MGAEPPGRAAGVMGTKGTRGPPSHRMGDVVRGCHPRAMATNRGCYKSLPRVEAMQSPPDGQEAAPAGDATIPPH